MTENNKLNALLVRHIGDLEASIRHVRTVLDTRLWEEAGQVADDALDDAQWDKDLDASEEEISFAHRGWLHPGKEEGRDAWLDLNERPEPGRDTDESWVGEFLNAGPEGAKMVLFFEQDLLKPGAWKKLLKANGQITAKLQEFGFSHDAGEGELFIPIILDRETLATAFEKEDFEEALAPFKEAILKVVKALPVLDQLVAATRKNGS